MKMYYYIILLMALVANNNCKATFDDLQGTCDACTEGMSLMGSLIATDEEISRQLQLLDGYICQDNLECSVLVRKWWPDMSRTTFLYKDTAPAVCLDIGACVPDDVKKRLDVSCDLCQDILFRAGQVLASQQFLRKLTNWLTGDLFCAQQGDQVDDCVVFVESYTKDMMHVVGRDLAMNSTHYCNLAFDGLCPSSF